MTDLLPFIVTGLATGSLYGLAGLGLVLTYRTSGVFNFAHGTVAAGGAYIFYTLHVTHGLPWPVAAAGTIALFATVVAFLLERLTRALTGAPEVVMIVATIGLLLTLQGLVFLQYGNVTRSFPQFLPTSGFSVAGVYVSWAQVISFSVAGGAALSLYAFLQRSRTGIAMRAVVDDPRLVSLSGGRPNRVRLAGWSIGSAAAAVSGILLAPTLNLDVNLLTLLVVQAFGACAIGYFVSLPLTFVGGLLVGVLASVSFKYFTTPPLSGIPSAVPFLVLIAALLLIPRSKLPGRSRPPTIVRGSTRAPGRATLLLVAGAIAVAALLPTVVGTKVPVWTTALTYVIVFASLGLLTWASGQISLCHAAFVALGATTMAHLQEAGVPWLLAVFLAGLLTIPVGAAVAIPAIRLSGIYLALATLGFGLLMQNVVYPSGLMFGRALNATVTRPEMGPFDGGDDRHLYWATLAIVVVACASLVMIDRSRLGRILRGLSESPIMLTTHGLGVPVTRLIVFCLSAFFAGVGGALAVTQAGSVSSVTYGPLLSLSLLAVLTISGTGVVRSAVVAALFHQVVPGYFSGFDSDRQTLVFGLLALGAAMLIARRSALAAWVGRAAESSAGRRRGPARAPWAEPRADGVAPAPPGRPVELV